MNAKLNPYDVIEMLGQVERGQEIDLDHYEALVASFSHQRDTNDELDHGWAFVYAAAKTGHASLVERMIALADPQFAKDSDFHYGLKHACQHRWPDVVEALAPYICTEEKNAAFGVLIGHHITTDAAACARSLLSAMPYLGQKNLMHFLERLCANPQSQALEDTSALICARINWDQVSYEGQSSMDQLATMGTVPIQSIFSSQPPEACARALFDLLNWMERKRHGLGERRHQSFQSNLSMLYGRCEEFMLSYADPQLRVILNEDIHIEFWTLHRQAQERQRLTQATKGLGRSPIVRKI